MSFLLAIHITAGLVSVLMGLTALVVRKGDRIHRGAGKIFVPSMIVMSITAFGLGLDIGNLTAAGLTIYMVGTAWLTVRRPPKSVGIVEVAACLAAFAFAGAGYWSAYQVASGAVAPSNPFIVPATIVLSSGVALAALGDLSVILRRGVAGPQRIARHLWRMCFGLMIALGSFAAQGLGELPAFLRGPAAVFGPMLLLFLVMVFWLVRVLFTRWYRE